MKYKKCCLRRPSEAQTRFVLPELYAFRNAIAQYRKYDVVNLLSAVAHSPQNHSHSLLINLATLCAISVVDNGNMRVTSQTLVDILNQCMPTHGTIARLCDPQECLYTDIILFSGENYIVYPQVLEDTLYGVQNLLNTIFQTKNQLPSGFKSDIKAAATLLLSISDKIAHSCKHIRYEKSPRNVRTILEDFNSREHRNNCTALVYKKSSLTGGSSYLSEILEQFCLNETEFTLSNINYNANPLHVKPLYALDDLILVASPNSILSALMHYILKSINKYSLQKELFVSYKKAVTSSIVRAFNMIGFHSVEAEYQINSSAPVDAQVFKFDSNKIAYLNLVYDDFTNYDPESFSEDWNIRQTKELNNKTYDEVLDSVITKYCKFEIFEIGIIVPIGREFGPTRILNRAETIFMGMTLRDFMLLWYSRKMYAYDMFKYAVYLESYSRKIVQVSFSAMDLLHKYVERGYSFYEEYETMPTHEYIDAGSANSFRQDTKNRLDFHLERYNADSAIEVLRLYNDRSIPLYKPKAMEFMPSQLIMGFNQNIWVSSRMFKSNYELYDGLNAIVNCVAYWIWKATEYVAIALEQLGKTPIHIILNYKNPQFWAGSQKGISKTDSDFEFYIDSDGYSVQILIPDDFSEVIRKSGNAKDKQLILAAFKGFNCILAYSGANNITNIELIAESLTADPKQTMIQSNGDNSHPFVKVDNVSLLRLLQDHDSNMVLDDLAFNAVHNNLPDIIRKKDDKQQVCASIVKYLTKVLVDHVGDFNSLDLLSVYYHQYESLLREKEINRKQMEAQLACWGEELEMKKQFIENNQKFDKTTLPLRVIIELIGTLQPCGDKNANTTDCDYMLALMEQLIVFGLLGDEIRLDIYTPPLYRLATGRIGRDRKFINSIREPYSLAYHNDLVDMELNSKKYDELIPDEKNYEELKNQAYKAEFGINLIDFQSIMILISDFAIEQKEPICIVNESDLVMYIFNRLESPLTPDTIRTFVSALCTFKRSKWNEVEPPYVLKKDVYPWKYNRRLSLLRKPIISYNTEGRKILVYGYRTILQSLFYFDQIISNGKYNDQAESTEMRSYISTVLNANGSRFNTYAFKWIEKYHKAIDDVLRQTLPINGKKGLRGAKELGDIDILWISRANSIVYSIECKDVTATKIPSEINSEIRKIRELWIPKHLKRHEWLANNMDSLEDYTGLPLHGYEVQSIILTSNTIMYPYIESHPTIKFKSLRILQREGMDHLLVD